MIDSLIISFSFSLAEAIYGTRKSCVDLLWFKIEIPDALQNVRLADLEKGQSWSIY